MAGILIRHCITDMFQECFACVQVHFLPDAFPGAKAHTGFLEV